MFRISSFVFLVASLVACNPGADGSGSTSVLPSPIDTTNSSDGSFAAPDSEGSEPDSVGNSVGDVNLPGGGYPAGPYGVEEGSVLEDLSFLLPDNTSISLSDIRNEDGAKILMVSTSAGWCTACIEEQPTLQQYHNTYGPSGLEIMVSLFQDANYTPATVGYVKQWKNQYNLDFWVVADPDFIWSAYYDSSLTPMNMIIRLEDMKILYLRTGFDESTVEAIIGASL